MKKRISIWATLFILFLLIVPTMAFGEDNINDYSGYEYTVNEDGTASIVGCDDSVNGEISIPEEIEGHTVVSIEENAFSNNNRITSVTMPNSIKKIGKSAFFNSSLTCVAFSNSLETIGNQAFNCCNSIKELNIPDTVIILGVMLLVVTV